MATKSRNGNNLEQALLIQNQASFLSHLSETYNRLTLMEGDLEQIKAILLRHEQTLADLPEATPKKASSPVAKT